MDLPPQIYGHSDYTDLLRYLRSTSALVVRDGRTGAHVEENWPESPAEAWTHFTGLWHERCQGDSVIFAANDRASSLASMVHSLGAATVVAFLALPAVLLLILWGSAVFSGDRVDVTRFLLAVVLWWVFFLLQRAAYRSILRVATTFVDQVLQDGFQVHTGTTSVVPLDSVLPEPEHWFWKLIFLHFITEPIRHLLNWFDGS